MSRFYLYIRQTILNCHISYNLFKINNANCLITYCLTVFNKTKEQVKVIHILNHLIKNVHTNIILFLLKFMMESPELQ